MSDASVQTPLSYATPARRRDSLFGIIGLALSLFCSIVPVSMLWMLLSGKRHGFAAYSPYAANVGVFHFSVNWPWFAADTIALLLGVLGLYFGRPRFGAAAIAVAAASLVAVMTLVLGSPW